MVIMSTFSIQQKVAIITGGAGGIGLDIAKNMLRNGAKGVTLADIDKELGDKALEQLDEEFGRNRAFFVQTDVRDIDQFEDAFLKTIEVFKNVDILVNNAGILDDSKWSNEIDVNVKGTINGMLLGFEKYLQTHRSSGEAVIMNISSIAGVNAMGSIPVYSSTKFAIHGLTLAWGAQGHYQRTKVKVVAICPGTTLTNLLAAMPGKNLGAAYEEQRIHNESGLPEQTTGQCAAGAIQVMELAQTGTVWIIEGAETPYEYVLPDRFKIVTKKYVTD